MDSPTLVTDDIDSGTRALQRLDHAHIPVRAALWLYDNAASEWRYIVATPLADVEGPRALYERIGRAFSRSMETRGFPIWRLVTLSPKNDLFTAIRKLVGKMDVPDGLALTLPIGGHDDTNVLVYRMA